MKGGGKQNQNGCGGWHSGFSTIHVRRGTRADRRKARSISKGPCREKNNKEEVVQDIRNSGHLEPLCIS